MFFREEALATDRFPQIVFLEFFPKPYEVIFKSEFADMEQLFARLSKEYQGIGLSDYVREASV